MSKSIKRRRNTYYISSILIVVFLFSYYFFAYIPQRESEMNERGMRVMKRMVKNISEREDHYVKSIDLFECDYLLNGLLENYDATQGGSSYAVFENVLRSTDCSELRDTIIQIARDLAKKDTDKIGTSYRIMGFGGNIDKYVYYIEEAIDVYISLNINSDPIVELASISSQNKFLFKRAIQLSDMNDYVLGISPENLVGEVKRYEFFKDIFISSPINDVIADDSRLGLRYFNYQPSVVAESAGDSLLNGLKQDVDLGVYQIPSVDIVKRRIGGKDYYCFTTNLVIQNAPYYLTGLIEVSEYNSMVRSVSIWVVMISVVFLIFLIQVLPIIKPFVLSNKERLGGSDVTWAALALVFGVSAIALFIIGIDTFKIEEQALVDKKLSHYANKIEEEFKTDVSNAKLFINQAKKIYYPQKYKGNLDASLHVDTFLNVDVIRQIPHNARFLSINNQGLADYFTIPNKSAAKNSKVFQVNIQKKPIDLSHREYYQALAAEPYTHAWSAQDGEPYIVESLFSLSEGKYETVVATRTEQNQAIFASVYPFRSVNNAYLEPDYTYAIVDEKGVIQYHSDQTKILNENILDETDHNERLYAYLKNSTSASLPLTVSLKDHQAFIKPIKGTPWHIVTLYDIKKSRMTITSSMGSTFALLIILLAFLFLLHTIFRLTQRTGNEFTIRRFSYQFLNPINTSPRVYGILIAVNLLAILLLSILYKSNTYSLPISVFSVLGVTSTLVLFTYGLLIRYSFDYQNEMDTKHSFSMSYFEIVTLLFSLLFIFLQFNFIQGDYIAWPLVVFEVILLAIFLWSKLEKGFSNYLSSQGVKNTYNLFFAHTFTWIIMLGFLPAVLFFKPVYNLQHINRSLSKWVNEAERINHSNHAKSYKWHQFSLSDGAKLDTLNNDDVLFNLKLIEALSFYLSEESKDLLGLNSIEGLDLHITKGEDENVNLPFIKLQPALHPMHFVDVVPPSPNRVVGFAMPRFSGNNKLPAFVFWATVAFIFLMVYITVVLLSQKFFYFNLLSHLRAIRTKRAIGKDAAIEDLKALRNSRIQNIMLVGPPYAGRNSIANQILGEDLERKYLDFINDIANEKEKLTDKWMSSPIIINNFDYQLFDEAHNNIKLEILEKIIQYRNEHQVKEKLILIATFDTAQLLSFYKGKLKEAKAEKADDTVMEELEKAIFRWESVLYGFVKHTVSLRKIANEDSTARVDNRVMWIENELSYGNALEGLKIQVYNFWDRLGAANEMLSETEKKERVIDAIIDLAQNYYFSIWNSCTREQRFMLYDLAQDGLINSKNEQVIFELVRRGVVVTDPSLRIFNESFSKFVLANISEEEGTQMEKEAKRESAWGSYRVLVISLILIIIIFLSFVERDAIAKITGVISFAGVLLPKMINLFNNMGSSVGKVFKKPGN